MTCLVTGSGAIGTGYGLSDPMRVGMPSLSYTTRPGVTVMVSTGSGGPSIGSGTFQTGSHEICGSVAARTCRAVVTTSMFMICSGSPVVLEVVPNSVVPVGSQLRIAAFVAIDDDGWAERDAHLIGAARHVEQHQQILAKPSSAEARRRRGLPFGSTWPSDSACGSRGQTSGERRVASSTWFT